MHSLQSGASIPSETMMHFPLFQISPLFSKKFRALRKILKMLPFPEKFLDFHPPKFFSPYFRCFSTFPLPCLAKIIISPYFDKFSPLFYANSTAFYILYVYF